MNYEMRLCLTKFIDSRVVEVENNDGVVEEGVFIPIYKNNLWRARGGNIYAYAYCNERMRKSRTNWTHYIKIHWPKRHKEKVESLGFDVPFIGDMRANNRLPNQVVYNSGSVRNDYGI